MLAGVVRSISSRSKAFKTRVQGFCIGIETDSESDSERLNLELRSWRDNPDRLTFAFWDDGTFWIDARQPSKNGWAYEFSFYGNVKNVDPDVVRDMIERSLWISDRDQMQTVWNRCNPHTR